MLLLNSGRRRSGGRGRGRGSSDGGRSGLGRRTGGGGLGWNTACEREGKQEGGRQEAESY
jgi:hypothetical protein